MVSINIMIILMMKSSMKNDDENDVKIMMIKMYISILHW